MRKLQTELKQSASQIKDRQNRQSVRWALAQAIEQLRMLKRTPETGVALFIGRCIDSDGHYV